MKKLFTMMSMILMSLSLIINAQKNKTDAHIIGHVVSDGEHIPFAHIALKGTTIGTTTDATGHYRLTNVPEGSHIIHVTAIGYKPVEQKIRLNPRETKELKFEIQEDMLSINEIVVTGSKREVLRKEAPVIVNSITPKLFNTTQSVTLSEGLNFSPGLRVENNCQNCGFNQVRMNGMEGPYSQILINSQPIFSGLAGVYGLEIIPANMIDRVEVIRGGGSALYGSNAIAGTINILLKDPEYNSYEFGMSSRNIGIGMDQNGGNALDNTLNFNTSIVSADNGESGLAVYGFFRNRQPFDANDDGFSELASIDNLTVGTRIYHHFGDKHKLGADFFTISDARRGGNRHEYPYHEADIAEGVEHNITSGALTWDSYIGESDKLSVYLSGQHINRDSYYGAEQSLSSYGNTDNLAYNTGVQYHMQLGASNIIGGIEYRGEILTDKKLGYPDIANATIEDSNVVIGHKDNQVIVDQTSGTSGAFLQYELELSRFKFSAGGRLDDYRISDKMSNSPLKSGSVFSPRLTFLYDVKKYLQARVSYSQGYRAPQVFDEDLHVETSASRQVKHVNDPDLTQETSHSYMASLDFNNHVNKVLLGILVEGFYTQLNDPFSHKYGEKRDDNVVIYTRVNAEETAIVQGVNIELNIRPDNDFSFKSGFTIQSSKYKKPQEFNEQRFFRTPDDYGYFTADWKPVKQLGVSATGNYTGKMLVPYFGVAQEDPEAGMLRKTNRFYDMGIKIRYNWKLNGASMQFFTGIKNLFNSYQDDFDYGENRDPGYIYGPLAPRAVYAGIKFGNALN